MGCPWTPRGSIVDAHLKSLLPRPDTQTAPTFSSSAWGGAPASARNQNKGRTAPSSMTKPRDRPGVTQNRLYSKLDPAKPGRQPAFNLLLLSVTSRLTAWYIYYAWAA